MEMPRKDTLKQTAESRAQSCPSRLASHRNGVLPISIQAVYSLQIIVPVVQRTEQGFPNAKTAFLLQSADVVSDSQITAFKGIE